MPTACQPSIVVVPLVGTRLVRKNVQSTRNTMYVALSYFLKYIITLFRQQGWSSVKKTWRIARNGPIMITSWHRVIGKFV